MRVCTKFATRPSTCSKQPIGCYWGAVKGYAKRALRPSAFSKQPTGYYWGAVQRACQESLTDDSRRVQSENQTLALRMHCCTRVRGCAYKRQETAPATQRFHRYKSPTAVLRASPNQPPKLHPRYGPHTACGLSIVLFFVSHTLRSLSRSLSVSLRVHSSVRFLSGPHPRHYPPSTLRPSVCLAFEGVYTAICVGR